MSVSRLGPLLDGWASASMFSADFIVPPEMLVPSERHELAAVNNCANGSACREPETHDHAAFVAPPGDMQ